MKDFTNGEGESWYDVADVVHVMMCPDTGQSCHSLCMCYRAYGKDKSDEERERLGYPTHVATCTKYDVHIHDMMGDTVL